MSNELFRLQQVSKSFHDGARTLKILQGINLTVTAGQQIAIMGKSGSGKSTLLQILAGLDTPSQGQVLWEQQDLAQLSSSQQDQRRRSTLGFVYQMHHLLKEFTALENLLIPAAIAALPRAEAQARAMMLLQAINLSERAAHYPNTLSGGEKQRLAIARALMLRPRCLLADEPTGSLDEEHAHLVLQLLKQLAKQQETTLVIVTHDREIAASMQQQYYLEAGSLSLQ
jgi:lipoprotein-releasing system ATP-binding protein